MTLEKIKDFHIQNNYYVNIQPLKTSLGCVVNFPKNVIHNFKNVDITYMISHNYDNIDIFYVEESETKSKNIQTLIFNTRLLILEDILLKSLQRGISKELVVIDSNRIKSNIFSIIGVKLSEEHLNLEKELCSVFLKLLEGNIIKDIKDDLLLKGYEQVFNCFENGGL
jgi:hypothetical protein